MQKFELKKLDRNNQIDYQKWKKCIQQFKGTTIFHDPDFLSYHKRKFQEFHLGVFKGQELFGIIPMAISKKNEEIANSPYGGSYGGFIFSEVLNYSDSIEIVDLFIEFLKKIKIKKIVLTPPLPVYYDIYSNTFIFSLIEKGMVCINSDISSLVYLSENNKLNFNHRAKRVLKKINLESVNIDFDSNLTDFIILLNKTYKKHGVSPTHTNQELNYLKKIFRKKIKFSVAYCNNEPVSGICEFEINKKVLQSYYICQDYEYKKKNIQTYHIKNLLDKAYINGYSIYDLGTSSVNTKGRKNIFSFKEGLGAVGHLKNTYKLKI